jgi:hypothetical protein
MPVAVHRQGAGPVALADPQPLQRPDQPARPAFRVGPGAAMRAAVVLAGDDVPLAVMPGGVLQQAGNHQVLRLHQAEHDGASDFPALPPGVSGPMIGWLR